MIEVKLEGAEAESKLILICSRSALEHVERINNCTKGKRFTKETKRAKIKCNRQNSSQFLEKGKQNVAQ